MQLALRDRQEETQRQLAAAWDQRAKGLPAAVWPRQATDKRMSFEHFIPATRVARELRSQIAISRGDPQAELRASDDTIATQQAELRDLLEPKPQTLWEYWDEDWVCRLVVALEAEKHHRAQLMPAANAESDEAQTLRRLGLARAAIVKRLESRAYQTYWHYRWSTLDLADRLIFELSRRDPRLLVDDPQLAEEYTDFLLHCAPLAVQAGAQSPTFLTVYFLRRLERNGNAIFRSKQRELHDLLFNQPAATWSQPQHVPTLEDWQREYQEELDEAGQLAE